jgi:hypothetical protein
MSPYGYGGRSQETHRRADGYDREQDSVEKMVSPRLRVLCLRRYLFPLLVVPFYAWEAVSDLGLWDTDKTWLGMIVGTRRTRITSR